jgi:pimeloyl-ACP methyl ester carboxylesterase
MIFDHSNEIGKLDEHVQPLEIHVADEVLDDLRERLARTRWIDDEGDGGWERGLSIDYMRDLVDHWRQAYDWRAEEVSMNRFSHFLADLDGGKVHFIHERGQGPDPLPIILTHGFPDSFLRFAKVIPMLADPASHGGDPADAFDVVVPSLPGYAFSDGPTDAGATFKVGDLWHRLMTERLGYEHFGAHGGDWGSLVTEILARDHADSVIGVHLTDIPFYHSFQKPDDVSDKEKAYLAQLGKFTQQEGAYALIQGSQPQLLALGLNDSPAGLAGWLVEKFRRWSDCDGDIEERFSKDELLANVMIYWVTQTINSSFAPYYDVAHAGGDDVDEAEAEGVDRFVRRSGGVRDLSQRLVAPATRVGRAILQRAALDGNATRRTFRGARGAGATREGHSRVLPAPPRRARRRLGGQLPVGTIAAVSTMRITVRSGARVRCSTPFGTTNPSRGRSSMTRPGVTPSGFGSRSMSKRPSTT